MLAEIYDGASKKPANGRLEEAMANLARS